MRQLSTKIVTLVILLVSINIMTPCPSGAAEESLAAVDDYNFAAWLYNDGKYGLAADAYQSFLDKYPGHERAPDALFGLAQALFHEEKYKQAAERYETLRKQHPDFGQMAQVLFQLAQARVALGDAASAATLFGECRRKFEEHYLAEWATAREASALMSLNRFEEAEELLEDFLSRMLVPGKPVDEAPATQDVLEKMEAAGVTARAAFLELVERSLFHLAVTRFNREAYEESENAFKRFLDRYGESELADEARFRLAQALYRRGAYAGAADMYEHVARTESDLAAAAAFERGLALYKAGDLEKAADVMAEVAERFPEHEKALTAALYSGTFLYEAGKYGAAVKRLREPAGGDTPSAAEAAYWLGMSLLKSGDASGAEQTFSGLLESAPRSDRKGDILLGLADALLEQGNRVGAAETYRRYARDFRKSEQAPRAMYSAAVALHRADEYAESDAVCEEFLKTFSRDNLVPEVLFLSGENRFLEKAYEQAGTRYRAVLGRKGVSADRRVRSRYRLAWVYRYGNELDKALALLGEIDPEQMSGSLAADVRYLTGICQFDQDAYEEAVKAFRTYLESKHAERFGDDALLKLAVARREIGETRAAVADLEQLLKTYPKSELRVQAHYQLAESAFDLGNYGQASKHYAEVLEADNAGELGPYAAYGIAECHSEEEEWSKAAEAFSDVVEMFPDSDLVEQALFRKGRSLMRAADWAGAEEAFREQANVGGDALLQRSGIAMLATCLQEQGLWDEAAETFVRILEEYPSKEKDARILYEAAWSWREAGQKEKALDFFEKLAAKYPENELAADAFFHLAESKYLQATTTDVEGTAQARLLGEARRLYERILAAEKNERLADKALYRLAWCLELTGEQEKAAEHFDRLVDEYPESTLVADALFRAGEAYAGVGKCGLAVERYRTLIESPGFAEFDYAAKARTGLADCLLNLDDPAEAVREATVVTTRHGDSDAAAPAFFIKGKALYTLGKYEEALDNLSGATSRTRGEIAARAQFYIGQVYQAQERFREALKAYLRVVAIYERYPEWVAAATFESGKCYEALEQWREARTAYQKVVSDYKDTQWLAPAAERLKTF